MSADTASPRVAAVVAAVVPTIDPQTLERAIPWLRMLQERGVVPVVAANSAATAAMALPDGFVRSSDGTNGGFAHSVNRAARDAGEWDWLLLLNDDLQLTEGAVDAITAATASADPDVPALLMFDPEPPRTIPTSGQALLALTLWWEIPARLRRSGHDADPVRGALDPKEFKSFSAVAISRGSWERVGTLSEDFLFCYEDAEYARRFAATGGTAVALPVAIAHTRSTSTKSRIRQVLPAIASSAGAYLRASGVGSRTARALVAGALVVRTPLVLVASAPRLDHLRGIGAGIRQAVTGEPATLPPYASGESPDPAPARRARIAAFAERCVDEGRGGIRPWIRHPVQTVRVVVDAARLPELEAGPFHSSEGAAVRRGLSRNRRTWTPVDDVTAVLALPPTLEEYVQTPARRPIRRKVRVAQRTGVTWRPVTERGERDRLAALADAREQAHPDPTYRRAVPANDDLHDHDLWLGAFDAAGDPLLVAVIPTEGDWAVLRYFRTLADGTDATVARYLLTEALVGVLIDRGVRWLADTESPFVLPNGLRHFQRMVGYELYRVRRAALDASATSSPARTRDRASAAG